jgi:WD40 repeat protein
MKFVRFNSIGSFLILSILLFFSSSTISADLVFDEAINAIKYLPDGKIVIATGKSVIAASWQEKKSTLGFHDDYVTSLAQSIDGRIVISGGWDGRVRMWDLDTTSSGKIIYSPRNKIFAVALHPNGVEIAVGCSDSKVHIATLPPDQQETTLEAHSKSVTAER